MLGTLVQFLVSAAVIIAAGSLLTQFGDIIANRTRLGGLLVGSLLIAGATSLPELAVDITAVRMGAIDLAVGDLLGSSLFNLLILAVLDLTHYSHGRMFSKTSSAHALAGVTSMALTAIVGIFIMLGPTLGDVTLARLGPGSFALIAAYAMGIRLVYVGRQVNQDDAGQDDGDEPVAGRFKRLGLRGAIVGYLITAAAILAAAPSLAHAADELAEQTGLGGTFFGTTFVALCTSLPEVVTTLAAVRMHSFGLAIGNIFGSNCFNMLIFAPLDLAHGGSLLSAVSPAHSYTAFCVMLITGIVVLGQLYAVERKKPLLEPDALLTLALVIGSLTGLYFIR